MIESLSTEQLRARIAADELRVRQLNKQQGDLLDSLFWMKKELERRERAVKLKEASASA